MMLMCTCCIDGVEELLLPDFVVGWKELGAVASVAGLEAAEGGVADAGMWCLVWRVFDEGVVLAILGLEMVGAGGSGPRC